MKQACGWLELESQLVLENKDGVSRDRNVAQSRAQSTARVSSVPGQGCLRSHQVI